MEVKFVLYLDIGKVLRDRLEGIVSSHDTNF